MRAKSCSFEHFIELSLSNKYVILSLTWFWAYLLFGLDKRNCSVRFVLSENDHKL